MPEFALDMVSKGYFDMIFWGLKYGAFGVVVEQMSSINLL